MAVCAMHYKSKHAKGVASKLPILHKAISKGPTSFATGFFKCWTWCCGILGDTETLWLVTCSTSIGLAGVQRLLGAVVEMFLSSRRARSTQKIL